AHRDRARHLRHRGLHARPRPRRRTARGRALAAAGRARRARAGHRGPQGRGPRPGPVYPRQRAPRARRGGPRPGGPSREADPRDPLVARARRELAGGRGPVPVRGQPAEGRPREVARHGPAGHHPRRADARHRRGRQACGLRPHARAPRERRRRPVHLVRAPRGRRDGGPRARHARRPPRGRAARGQRRGDRDGARHGRGRGHVGRARPGRPRRPRRRRRAPRRGAGRRPARPRRPEGGPMSTAVATAAPTARRAPARRRRLGSTEIVYLALVGILVIAGVLVAVGGGNLFSTANTAYMLTQTSLLGFVAIGQTFAILCRSLDLSVGYVVALASIVGATTMAGDPSRAWLGVVAALGVSAVVGLVNGLVIAKLRVNAFIATLGVGLIIKG